MINQCIGKRDRICRSFEISAAEEADQTVQAKRIASLKCDR
ncbi:hypothetical protein [Leptolyngbya sp. Heron Island J]|nr:hypothetical protein [Leptolyngbya sp. Heron Island J]